MKRLIQSLIKNIFKKFLIFLDIRFPWIVDDAMNRFIKHNIKGHKIYLFNLGYISRYRSISAFFKEPDTIKWIDSFESDSVFLDVGSFIGAYSIYAAINKNCKVYAIEPSINAIFINMMNIAKNNLGNKIDLYNFHISNFESIKYFKTPDNNDQLDNLHGINFLNDKASVIPSFNDSDRQGKYNIFSTRLDQIQFSKQINYIKIDIDGNEFDLLQGSSNLLKKNTVKSLMICLDKRDKKYKSIINFIENHSFKLNEELNIYSRPSKKREGFRINHFFYRLI